MASISFFDQRTSKGMRTPEDRSVGRSLPFYSVLLCVLFLSSCSWLQGLSTPAISDSGAMIVRYGSYIYSIGGKDSSGDIVPAVKMARINLDGSGQPQALVWSETAPLPEGRAFGAAFAAAYATSGLMYVLGGDDGSGPTSTVFYTSINATDGTLGFGTERRWEQNTISLDSSRSHAAWEINDGRIFLIGGKNPWGAVDSIVHARLYADGGIGQWYTSPQKLPSARYGAASTIYNGSLWVAGGASASNVVKNELVSFTIGSNGLLSNRVVATLPKALYSPLLLSDDDSMLLCGGYDAQFTSSQTVYRGQGSTWSGQSTSLDAEGPSSSRAAGTLFYLKKAQAEGPAEICQESSFALAPDRINVVPGSGMVYTGCPIRLKAEPGVTVHYRPDGSTVSIADSVWSAYNIPSATTLSLCAFSSGGLASPQAHMAYRTSTLGWFVSVSGDLPIKASGAGLDTVYLRDDIYTATSVPVAEVWCCLTVLRRERFAFSFADSAVGGSGYTARAKLSLFEVEPSRNTEVLDDSGAPVLDYTTGTTGQPFLLTLNPDSYYLRIEDLAATPAGQTIGVAFTRR
ncbi:MAG: hypothetical protein NT061_02580 [Spirochaetes bacterium]|nr:hypothetical protein [Spirochaetota bacterium]